MRKLNIFVLLFCLMFFLSACENSNKLIIAKFSNVTAAGSSDFAVKVVFEQDDRLSEKYYDLQIMSDVDDVNITFWKEFEDKVTTTIAEKDRWNSLTSLTVSSSGLVNTESFQKLKDAKGFTIIFNVDRPVKLFLRIVAGEVEPNDSGLGYVIINTEPVSDEFILDCYMK